jgi:hypothetical protein
MTERFTERELDRALNELDPDGDDIDILLTQEAIRLIAAFSLGNPRRTPHPLGRAEDIINGIRVGVMLADHQADATAEIAQALEDAGLS